MMNKILNTLTLIVTLTTLVSAKSDLEALKKYAMTFRAPQIGIDMVLKLHLMPRYGQEQSDYALALEDLNGIESAASISLVQISDSLYRYLSKLVAASGDHDLLKTRININADINAFLVEPCKELDRRVGHLISRLGESREELAWKAKSNVCRKVLADVQSVQLEVCRLAQCNNTIR